MNIYEKIWKLSHGKIHSLRRQYSWWNSLFIAFLVALILQLTNLFREIIYRPKVSTFVVEWIAMALILIFIMISVRERRQHEIAIEIKEDKLQKTEAFKHISEEYYAF
jgi:hypothetical protein